MHILNNQFDTNTVRDLCWETKNYQKYLECDIFWIIDCCHRHFKHLSSNINEVLFKKIFLCIKIQMQYYVFVKK